MSGEDTKQWGGDTKLALMILIEQHLLNCSQVHHTGCRVPETLPGDAL